MPRPDTDDDDDSFEGPEWFDLLEEVTSVEEGMAKVYELDKEAFYTIGDTIEKMLTYRFEKLASQ